MFRNEKAEVPEVEDPAAKAKAYVKALIENKADVNAVRKNGCVANFYFGR